MRIRRAEFDDVAAMHTLRVSVRENRLSDPSRVTTADYERRIMQAGACWVAEEGGGIEGFAIADYPSRSIWALFVKPGSEGRGIGRALLERVTRSLEALGPGTIHLSTDPGTRAERLYVAAGWARVGYLPTGELHFVREVSASFMIGARSPGDRPGSG